MIVQSEAYRRAVKLNSRESRVRGTITFADDSTVSITNDDVQKGSFSITNKCVSNSSFAYGAVYCGELSITLLLEIDRYSLYGSTIEMYQDLRLEDNSWESTKLGIFVISEANRKNSTIEIKAYDRMLDFEKEVDESTYDNAYALFSMICEKCGVGLATTEQEMTAMPNASNDQYYTLRLDYIDTYRDAISCLSALMCAFCTINADGMLEVRQWGEEPVDVLTNDDWQYGCSISDFESYFFGVKMRFIANENYYPYTAHEEFDNGGLLLDLGDNPIVIATQEEKSAIVEAIFEKLRTVRYVPFNMTINKADPSFELGDMVTINFPDGGSNVGYVMESTWKWRVGHTLKCLGANPKLMSAKDKAAKSLLSFEKVQPDDSMVVHSYTNAKDLVVSTSEQTLVSLFNISAVKDTNPIILLTVPIVMTCDAYVIVRVSIDNVVDEGYVCRKYLPRGENFVTWSYYTSINENGRHTYRITFQLEYFESDYRKELANRKTNENAVTAMIEAFTAYENEEIRFDPNTQTIIDREKVEVKYDTEPIDTTVTNGTIAQGMIKGVMFASGLTAGENWDGTLNFSEKVMVDFDEFVINASDRITNIVMHRPTRRDLTDRVNIGFDNFAIVASDALAINEVVERCVVSFATNNYTEISENKVVLRQNYEYNSNDETIDNGALASVIGVTTDKASIESYEVIHSLKYEEQT